MEIPKGYIELPFRGKIARADLDTADRGAYRLIGSEIERDRIFDPTCDVWHEGPTVLLARIDNGKLLPEFVEEARFRSDGKRLIIVRSFDDEKADGPFFELKEGSA